MCGELDISVLEVLSIKGELFLTEPYWENTGGGNMVVLMEFTPTAAEFMDLPGKAVAIGDECASCFTSLDAFWNGDVLDPGEYICDSHNLIKSQQPTKHFKSLNIDWVDVFSNACIELILSSNFCIRCHKMSFSLTHDDVIYLKGSSV